MLLDAAPEISADDVSPEADRNQIQAGNHGKHLIAGPSTNEGVSRDAGQHPAGCHFTIRFGLFVINMNYSQSNAPPPTTHSNHRPWMRRGWPDIYRNAGSPAVK